MIFCYQLVLKKYIKLNVESTMGRESGIGNTENRESSSYYVGNEVLTILTIYIVFLGINSLMRVQYHMAVI